MPSAAAQRAIARARATVLGRAKALTRQSIRVRDRKVRCILYEVNAALLLCRYDWNSGCGTLPHALAPLSIDAEAILDLDQNINGSISF
jgi:hypothetical protein